MSSSDRLRLTDYREVFRLLGEVRELGADASAWRLHALAGLRKLTGATVGITMEAYSSASPAPAVAVLAHEGWAGDRERAVFMRYVEGSEMINDHVLSEAVRRRPELRIAYPMLTLADGQGMSAAQLQPRVMLRQHFIKDHDWYRSQFVMEQHAAGGTDHWVCSTQPLPLHGGFDQFTVLRPWRSKAFGMREKKVVGLFHEELARLWRTVKSRCVGPEADLPPRLLQVLDCFCSGCAEKEVAVKLGLSRQTVHAYAKALYLRMKVNSRPELLAACTSRFDFTPRLRGLAASLESKMPTRVLARISPVTGRDTPS